MVLRECIGHKARDSLQITPMVFDKLYPIHQSHTGMAKRLKKNLAFGIFLLAAMVFFFPKDSEAALRSWDGGGADTDWNTCANWSSDTCPISTDTVLFDATSTKDATVSSSSMTVAGMTINPGYSGTVSFGSSVVSIAGPFIQSAGTLTMSSATTTFRGDTLFNGGTTNHNSGLVQFANANTTTINATTTGVTFNNVLFDYIHSNGGTTAIQLGSDMTVSGNLLFKNNNNNSGNLIVRSNQASTTRTISVAGSMIDVTTALTGQVNIGNTVDTNRITISLMGDLNLQDSNTTLYADMVFASSSTQTITKSTSAAINSISDWFDTGSGNLALGSNFTGSMVFNTDDSSDFTFASSAFTLSLGNASITPATSYSPSGAATTTFTAFNLTSGTFNATASTTFASSTINGGTFNLASNATTTFTGNFTYNSGTFNHNGGTAYFAISQSNVSITLIPNSAAFNNVMLDYSYNSGGTLSIFFGSNMTVGGWFAAQNTNPAAGTLNVLSSVSSTNRIISVAGSLLMPSTSGGGTVALGASTGTALISFDLKGDMNLADSSAVLYADVAFSSSSTQTLIKTSSATINALSDWTDTGSGNFGLSANFTGSMNLVTDDSNDFNFVPNAFTFTAGSVLVSTSTAFNPEGPSSYVITTANLYSGTFNASVASTTFGTLNMIGGALNMGSATTTINTAFTYTSGTFNHNNGTMAFVFPTTASITASSGAAVLNNVFIDYPFNSGGAVSMLFASNMTVNGNFIVQNTNPSGGPLTLQSSVSSTNRTITVTGTFLTPSTSGSGSITIGPSTGTALISFDLKGDMNLVDSGVTLNADVNFSGSSTQTIARSGGTISALSDWTDTGSGNLGLNANFSGSMGLLPDSSDDFNFAPTAFTFTAGSATVTPSTTFNPEGPSTYTITTLNLNAGTFNASVASTSIGTLTISGGTFNAGTGTTSINNAFTYTSGTFNPNGGTIYFIPVNLSTTITVTPGGQAFNNVAIGYVSASGVATVSFAGDATINGNLIVSNSNTNTASMNVQSNLSGTPRNINVAGDVIFPSTSVGGTMNFGSSGGSTFRLNLNVAGNYSLLDNSINSYATTTFNGTSTQTINKSAGTLSTGFIIDKPSGQAVLANALSLSSANVAVASGTLRTAGFGVSGGTVVVSAPGTLLLQGTETLSATPTLAVSSTVTYEGSSTAPSSVKAYSYSNLTIQAGSNSVFLLATTTVSRDFNLVSGTLDASSTPSYGLNVGGNWSNTGTFVPRNSTVTLNGTDQTINGTTTFYKLTKSVASPATLTFAAGSTQTVSNAWTVNGASGNLLSLRSSNPGTQWRIDPQSTRTLSYLDVQDSNNINASQIVVDNTMMNSGNNTNWSFDSAPPGIAVTSTSTGTSTAIINWTTDEAATSTVQYGLTTGYGSQATSSGTTTHSVSLSGLTEATLYHFLITARDSGGNSTTTADMVFTTSDATAPTVSITSPASSTVRQTVALAATTTDNVGVVGVKFYINTTQVGSEDTSAPFTGSLDTTGFSDGPYTLRAVARDAAGNVATSTGVTIAIDNTPVLATAIASTTSTSSATVSWNTAEAATSTVQYGLTTSYGSQATSSGTSTHSVSLSSLTEFTVYHFRITTIDAAGNSTSTADMTFRTVDGTGPVFSAIASSTTDTTALITWNTDELSDSRVVYGTASGNYGLSSSSAALVTTGHSISLSGLTQSTLYYFRIVSKDAALNISTSSEMTFTTAAAPDTDAPTASNVIVTPSANSATVTWDTNEAATSTFRYSLNTSYNLASTSTGTSSHSVSITGLVSNTLYHYVVVSRDPSGNTATTTDATFMTTDNVAPIISLTGTSTTNVTATINWTTDEAASSSVSYGLTTGYGLASTSLGATSHTVVLSGLTASTTYHFKINATDASSNSTSTGDYLLFTTDNPDINPPSLSAGSPTGSLATGTTQATISVHTDENATCRYATSAGIAYGSMTGTFTTTGTTTHSTLVTGLSDGGSYSYYVRCIDGLGNANASDFAVSFSVAANAAVVPPANPEPVPAIQPGAQVGQETPGGPAFTTLTTPHEAPGFLRAKQQAGQLAKIDEVARAAAEAQARARATAFKYVFRKDLQLGDKGLDVLNLQKALNLLGFKIAASGAGSPGKETALFGPATKQALIRFQQANGIKPASGFFGPLTRAKMNALLAK